MTMLWWIAAYYGVLLVVNVIAWWMWWGLCRYARQQRQAFDDCLASMAESDRQFEARGREQDARHDAWWESHDQWLRDWQGRVRG